MKFRKLMTVIIGFVSNFVKRSYIVSIVAIFFICIAFLLSGCSEVEDAILKNVGVMTDEEYEKYRELRDTDQLDQDGYYRQEGILLKEETDIETDTSFCMDGIHVTFAQNAFLEVNYYLDEEMTISVDKSCYLKPGDCIYASEPICRHPSSNWYQFDHFCVWAYDDSGHRREELFWREEGSEDNLVVHVPADYEGNEISVEPMGKYKEHSIRLTDYYIDSTGQKQEVAGKWCINEEEITGRTFEASPVEELSVDYTYDPNEYCFVSSNPDSFYHGNGFVKFESVSADSNIEEYSVELRPVEGVFTFDPLNYPVYHGKVTFFYKNSIITEKRSIPDGDTIDYVAEPEIGYRHPEERGKIVVDASNTDYMEQEITEALRFYVDDLVEVILPQPEGGKIEYMADGKVLAGDKCKLRCGTEITMNFLSWNGWKCKMIDGVKYVVNEQKVNQNVTIDGEDINSTIFTESDQHKPLLKIIVEKNLQETLFEVTTSDIQKEELSYATGIKTTIVPDWLGQNNRLIFEEKVGTNKGITLKITNDTILKGDALKLEITTSDTNSNTEEVIQYITKLPVERKILLYEVGEIADSSKVFKEVCITVSRVKVISYEPKTIHNATMQAVLENEVLNAGDVLEDSRDIIVTITPESGYVVTGSNTENGIYNDTMTYSKWEKKWEKIIEDHPIKKVWHVTLDTSDEYGECIYELDGKEVSGTIEVYEGQNLTLKYTLDEDSGYQIRRKEWIGSFADNLIHGSSEKEVIPISEELDGKTIRRSDYITIVPKGE